MLEEPLYGAVIRREAMYSTAFGGGIALPHPDRLISDTPRVAVAVLDTPIAWDEEHPVQIVFLLNPDRNSQRQVQRIYTFLSAFIQDRELSQRLLREPEWPTLQQLLQSREK